MHLPAAPRPQEVTRLLMLSRHVSGGHSDLLVILNCHTLEKEDFKKSIWWFWEGKTLFLDSIGYTHTTLLREEKGHYDSPSYQKQTPTFLLWPRHELSVRELAHRVETAELVAGLRASQPAWGGGCQGCSFGWYEKSGMELQGPESFLNIFGQKLTSWICEEKCWMYHLLNEHKPSSSQNLPDQAYGLARPKARYSPRFR